MFSLIAECPVGVGVVRGNKAGQLSSIEISKVIVLLQLITGSLVGVRPGEQGVKGRRNRTMDGLKIRQIRK